MTLERPDWLNDRFLTTCLQNGIEDKLLVLKRVDITSVVPPGNNFGGSLWRVTVEYQTNSSETINRTSLIVKKPTEVSSMKEVYAQFSMVEPTFYKSFMPKAYQISPNINFAPVMHFSTIPDVIILNDLKDSGYIMADRRKLLDFDHCRLYIIAAANFHAVSVAVHNMDPNLVESLGGEKTFLNDAVTVKRSIFIGMYVLAEKMAFLNEYRSQGNILRDSVSRIWDLAIEALKPSATLNTLHQGDPWITNMMFKYNSSGNVIDVKLLDFQNLRYSSPVNDLVFFLWTSANHEVRENKLEELYHIYCAALNEKLEEFGCSERLSYEDLLANLKRLSPFALLIVASFFPSLISNKILDPSALLSGDDRIIKIEFEHHYNKEYCINVLPRVLRQVEAAGIFDYINTKIQEVS